MYRSTKHSRCDTSTADLPAPGFSRHRKLLRKDADHATTQEDRRRWATGRVGRHVVAVATERGYDVVPMSRSQGVDVITGTGLAAALAGVDCVIDTATGP